jgi:hypothetical protein
MSALEVTSVQVPKCLGILARKCEEIYERKVYTYDPIPQSDPEA